MVGRAYLYPARGRIEFAVFPEIPDHRRSQMRSLRSSWLHIISDPDGFKVPSSRVSEQAANPGLASYTNATPYFDSSMM